jgi:hypothetical protein
MTCPNASKRTMSEMLIKLRQLYNVQSDDMFCLFDLRNLPEMSAYRLAQQMRPIIEKHTAASHIALVLDDEAINAPDIALHTVHDRNSVQYFTRIDKAESWLQLEDKRTHQSHTERVH